MRRVSEFFKKGLVRLRAEIFIMFENQIVLKENAIDGIAS